MRALMLLIACSAQAQNQLDSLVDLALRQNTMLHAVSHDVAAARAVIDQAGAWDAPQIGIEFFQVPVSSFPIPTKGNMEMDYFVRQTIPWPGKTRRMTEMATESSQMKNHTFQALRLDLIQRVRSIYYDLYFVDRRIAINREIRELLGNLESSLARDLEVGRTRQTDWIGVQSEIVRRENDSLMLATERIQLESDLNALMNRAVDTPIRPNADLRIPTVDLNAASLSSRAASFRPELKSLDNMRRMFLRERQLASREAYPNIMLEGMYKDMVGRRDFWSLMIGVDVPVVFWSRGRYRAKELESDQHIRHAEMEKESLEQEIAASIRKQIADVRHALQQMQNSKQRLIPYARRAIDAVTMDYQTGRAPLDEVLRRYTDLLEAQEMYFENQTRALKSVNDLQRSTGSMEEMP